jgi:hypothetical protein
MELGQAGEPRSIYHVTREYNTSAARQGGLKRRLWNHEAHFSALSEIRGNFPPNTI